MMAANIDPTVPIVDEDGKVTSIFNLWILQVVKDLFEPSVANLPTGSTAAAAGVETGEAWVTSSHATLPDGVIMRAT